MNDFDVREFYKTINVLDKGFVTLTDGPRECPKIKIVNAARVSFNKKIEELSDKDMKLIGFLCRKGHFSCLRHSHFSLHIKLPLSVARQLWKYQIGADWEENELYQVDGCGSIILPSTSWNEASGRYIEFKPEFYIPKEIRIQSENNKQGSFGKLEELKNGLDPVEFYLDGCQQAYDRYQYLLECGAAKEQCRMLLPQAIYTECIVTMSLQAIMFMLHQRLKSDAQYENREYAKAIKEIMDPIFEPLKLFDSYYGHPNT